MSAPAPAPSTPPNPADGILASAQAVVDELGRLTGSLNYLQDVCSTLGLNQTTSGMDAMVTIAQAHSTIEKTSETLLSMAQLLQPLVRLHLEARHQLQRDPAAQPAWLREIVRLAAAGSGSPKQV